MSRLFNPQQNKNKQASKQKKTYSKGRRLMKGLIMITGKEKEDRAGNLAIQRQLQEIIS